jgi:hypothetical protein
MRDRDQKIYEEASALWRELFGEAPPIRADGAMMLDVIMKSLPERSYERLASPHLRPSQIRGPKAFKNPAVGA